MIYHTLKFTRVTFLQQDIAELIFHDGIEVTKEMVDELHAYLKVHLKAPFSILINKLNDYSYDFEAQRAIGVITEIHAVAVICYNQVSKTALDVMVNLPKDANRDSPLRVARWNLQTFDDRKSALLWLEKQQKLVRQNEDLES